MTDLSKFSLLARAKTFIPGTRRTAALAGIMGALVGDALGVPHEAKRSEQLPRVIDMTLPESYAKSYAAIPYGTWSDDGAQLLALLDVLLSPQGYSNDAFRHALLAWFNFGRHQAGGVVFDCGGQTRHALEHLQMHGLAAPDMPRTTQWGMGNGCLMRVLPVAFQADRALSLAKLQAQVTHPDALPQVACAIYVAIAQALLTKPTETMPHLWQQACDQVARMAYVSDAHRLALLEIINWRNSNLPTGSGFVIDSLVSSIYALEHAHDYLSAVRFAVSMGNDTDTTACLVGGLAALRWGLQDLPLNWVGAMSFPDESLVLLDQLQF